MVLNHSWETTPMIQSPPTKPFFQHWELQLNVKFGWEHRPKPCQCAVRRLWGKGHWLCLSSRTRKWLYVLTCWHLWLYLSIKTNDPDNDDLVQSAFSADSHSKCCLCTRRLYAEGNKTALRRQNPQVEWLVNCWTINNSRWQEIFSLQCVAVCCHFSGFCLIH